jgi:hypothetical protein
MCTASIGDVVKNDRNVTIQVAGYYYTNLTAMYQGGNGNARAFSNNDNKMDLVDLSVIKYFNRQNLVQTVLNITISQIVVLTSRNRANIVLLDLNDTLTFNCVIASKQPQSGPTCRQPCGVTDYSFNFIVFLLSV